MADLTIRIGDVLEVVDLPNPNHHEGRWEVGDKFIVQAIGDRQTKVIKITDHQIWYPSNLFIICYCQKKEVA